MSDIVCRKQICGFVVESCVGCALFSHHYEIYICIKFITAQLDNTTDKRLVIQHKGLNAHNERKLTMVTAVEILALELS